jgi:phospholipid/cholesterol/gamma-HCH transport system substrate-binding protein
MKISREFKIGIIAAATIAGFIWGMNFLKGINIFKTTHEYYVVYDKIEGLIESGVIYLNGYKVGNVSEIKFDRNNPGKIIVKLALEEKVSIPVNSVAMITSSSMISGIKDLNLIFSDSTRYYNVGDTIPGGLDEGISAIIDPFKVQVEETIANIDSILMVMKNIFNKNTQVSLRHTFAHLDTITANLSTSLKTDGGLSKSIDNLAYITGELQKKSGELASIIENFSSVSDSIARSDIKSTINNTNKTIEATNEILQKIRDGEGTAGMLVNNDTLYYNLQNASRNLDILIKDLKDHPKRYVHFSLFGGKDKTKK